MRLKHRQKKRILSLIKFFAVLCTILLIKQTVLSPKRPHRMPVYFLSEFTPMEIISDDFNIIHVPDMNALYARATTDNFDLFLVLRERTIVSPLFKSIGDQCFPQRLQIGICFNYGQTIV